MLIDITDTVQLTHTAAEVDADIDGSVRGDIAQTKDDTWKAQARDNIGAGGGGGSSVTVTPIVTEGTNIADITVDGTTSHLYAPSGGGGIGRNLLMNPFFTINQRGQSSYTGRGYTIDRWDFGDSTGVLQVNNDHIILTSTGTGSGVTDFEQLLDLSEHIGKTLTVSVMMSDGNIHSGTAVFSTVNTGITVPIADGFTLYLGYYPSKSLNRVYIRNTGNRSGNSISIKAVKLELGSVSTLANDAPPDYTTELLKCMRYYYRGSGHPAFGFAHNATTARCMCPVAMRPLNASNPVVYSGTIYVNDGAGLHAPTAMALGAQSTASVTIQVTTSGLAAGNGCQIQCNAGAYIELNADL